jgi:hypothetical protein
MLLCGRPGFFAAPPVLSLRHCHHTQTHKELTMSTTQPTRHLLGAKPHHYVPAVSTDIRRTFRRFRLLARLQQKMTMLQAAV